jgi:membrane-associated protein
MIDTAINIFLHLDRHIAMVIHDYGIWTYLILFLIIFLEISLVIVPFLPGDSLLFITGAAAATGLLNIQALIAVFILGAVLGDSASYWIGNYLGLKVFLCRFPTLVKQEYIDQAYRYFEKYGSVTIFIARFVPLVRSFAPFLAGVGSMDYRRFLAYNILGGIAWTLAIVLAGYYLGSFRIVREHMNLLFVLVLFISAGTLLLVVVGILSSYFKKRNDSCTAK